MIYNQSPTLEEQFNSIKKLIEFEEFAPAISILQNLETKLNQQHELTQHSNLMLKIFNYYRRMKSLEESFDTSLELACLYLKFHKFSQALQLFSDLYKQNPKDHLIIYGLAKSLFEMGEDYSFLVNSLEKITDLKKEDQYKLHDLLVSFYCSKDQDDKKAISYLEKQLSINPEDPALNLKIAALIFKQTRCILSVEKYINYAIQIQGSERYTALYLKIMLAEAKEEPQIIEWTRELINSFPGSELSYLFLSENLCVTNIDYSIQVLREAVTRYPNNKTMHDNLIMNCQYSNNISNEENLSFAQNYYESYVVPFLNSQNLKFDFSNRLQTMNKKINVGFVSGDLKLHPIFFWLNGLFEKVSEEFCIFCYANNLENEYAEVLKSKIQQLTYVETLSNKELAMKIYEDQIDILIDLSGHTAANRLEVFALKPAPLQITWLGQSGPMGLPQIDYTLTDRFLIKEGEDKFHTEKIYRMKNCFAPYPAKDFNKPPINQNLARNDGSIILGSLNQFMKLNPCVFNAWAEILHETPHTKLIIKNGKASDPLYQEEVSKIFANHNVSRERLYFEAMSSKEEFLKGFNKIDICLDPFPVGGGTTTHETLMMSVPIITLAGKRSPHRSGESILSNAGLEDLVSHSREDYIEKNISLINDPTRILKYKRTIRDQYLKSAATNMEGFREEFFNVIKKLLEERISDLAHLV